MDTWESDVCSVTPPPPLKSSGVSREKRRRLFPLHRLCLICNQLISSASIPSGQLTNTVLLSWKDWQTHTLTHLITQATLFFFRNFRLSYINCLGGHQFFKWPVPLLFVCSDLIFFHMKAQRGMYLRATSAYHTYYRSKPKAEQNKEKSWVIPAFTMDQKQLAVGDTVANAWVTLVLTVILLNSNRFSLRLLKYKEDCTTALSVLRCLKQHFSGLNCIYQQLTGFYLKHLNTLSQRYSRSNYN